MTFVTAFCFIRLLKANAGRPKSRKDLTNENYEFRTFFRDLEATSGGVTVVSRQAAVPHFRQQLSILKSAKARFESSLFDIRQMVQADLFDSELDAAKELARHKFTRAAGALAGVVLERHLAQVCENHNIKVTKKAASISDLNDLLKGAGDVDVPAWRFIQHNDSHLTELKGSAVNRVYAKTR